MFAPEGVGESTDVEGNHVAARTVFVCPVYGMEVLSKKARVGIAVEVYSIEDKLVCGGGRMRMRSRGDDIGLNRSQVQRWVHRQRG